MLYNRWRDGQGRIWTFAPLPAARRGSQPTLIVIWFELDLNSTTLNNPNT